MQCIIISDRKSKTSELIKELCIKYKIAENSEYNKILYENGIDRI